jgi:glycosyltransferase XagB
MLAVFFLIGFGVVLEPIVTWGGFGALLLLPFVGLTGVRLIAAMEVLRQPTKRGGRSVPRVPDLRLPSYAVLVPMYDEPDVLPELVKGLVALDYPKDRLDLVLVLEDRDAATITAAARLDLPSNMRHRDGSARWAED